MESRKGRRCILTDLTFLEEALLIFIVAVIIIGIITPWLSLLHLGGIETELGNIRRELARRNEKDNERIQ